MVIFHSYVSLPEGNDSVCVCVCVWVKSTFRHFDEYAFCDICCFFVTPSVPRSLDVWYQLCVGVKVLLIDM